MQERQNIQTARPASETKDAHSEPQDQQKLTQQSRTRVKPALSEQNPSARERLTG